MSVGEYRRGGLTRGGREPFTLPRQGMLTAEQLNALRLAIGGLVSFAGTVENSALRGTFIEASETLQAMIDDDARAKSR